MTMSCLRIGFVGAGTVNFGGSEGPWDHASRLETFDNVEFVGIADPIVEKAKEALQNRLHSKWSAKWKNCQAVDGVPALLALKPDTVFIGTAPGHRASFENPLELQCLQAGAHIFVEKPLSVDPLEKFKLYTDKLIDAQKSKCLISSVGYMFRYHGAIMKIRELIAKHGGKVMAMSLRYALAYTAIDREFWWHKELSGGPVVEQATHFCDLARFIGGEVDLDSLQTTVLKETDAGGAGVLKKVPPGCEDDVPSSERVPRATLAQWHFKDGGIGSLMHCVAMHGKAYDSAIDIYLDGMRMTLKDPYTDACTLTVRDEMKDEDTVYRFENEDPYRVEAKVFVDAVRSGNSSSIASSYEDAAKTYEMTWKIRLQSEV